MNNIRLYPSNWLFNAGVVGLLVSLEEIEEVGGIYKLLERPALELPASIFGEIDFDKRYFGNNKIIPIVGKNKLYPNYLQKNEDEVFKKFVKALSEVVSTDKKCDLCGKGWWLPETKVVEIKNSKGENFLERIERFNIIHNNLIGPSAGKFPNAFWGLESTATICHLCAFIIIHHHLAFTKLSDNSEIFINAPSFKVMYYLNKFCREILASPSNQERRKIREILAMSVIEYAMRIQTTLGIWTGMNIEIVSKLRDNKGKGNKIEFFSLPYEIVSLLSFRDIASLLSQIGEFSILSKFLDGKFSELVETGYRVFRIGLKTQSERSNSVDDFIKNLFILNKNKNNPAQVATKIFKLYALVEERLKGGRYEFRTY